VAEQSYAINDVYEYTTGICLNLNLDFQNPIKAKPPKKDLLKKEKQ
jgi:hypothetical protein